MEKTEGLKILLVEDETSVAMLLERIVRPLLEKFPGSKITFAKRLSDALEEIRQTPAPDIVMLDLTLSDSTMEQTIARIPDFHSRAPLVIVTGHSLDTVRKLAGEQVEIVEKSRAFEEPGFLVRALLRVIQKWNAPRWQRTFDRQRRIDQLVEELNGTPQNTQ